MRRKALDSKYRMVRRLAVGGMAEVWLARNRATGADVAVKICKRELTTDEAVARFQHEARLGAMLSHRGIVRVFDLVEERDGSLALVMELLRGETLERYAKTKRELPQQEAVAIAVAILSALAHAHASGIVHRDVTPANIFLAVDPDGHVTPKLLDFGIARIPTAGDRRTLDGRVLGTPGYMAPERIRGGESVDERSDLFSVAAILYEMLTGICAFAAASPAASLAAVLEDVVDPDPRIAPRLWLELHRGLAKRPYERHPSSAAMAAALLAAIDESDASLSPWLRRDPPTAGDAPTATESFGTQTVGGQSYGLRGARSLGPKTIGWLAGVLTACVVVGAFELVPRRLPNGADLPSVPAATAPVEPRASLPPAEPTASSMAPEPVNVDSIPDDAAHETAPAAPSAKAGNAQRAPRRVIRPKPIGTTPGF